MNSTSNCSDTNFDERKTKQLSEPLNQTLINEDTNLKSLEDQTTVQQKSNKKEDCIETFAYDAKYFISQTLQGDGQVTESLSVKTHQQQLSQSSSKVAPNPLGSIENTSVTTKTSNSVESKETVPVATDKSNKTQLSNNENTKARKSLYKYVESKRKTDTTGYGYGLCGLSNLGNTCYMNSALQCLSNVPCLTNYILKNGLKKDINIENSLGTKGEVAKAYEDLIITMWSSGHKSTRPEVVKDRISQLVPRFLGCNQQDSYELMAILLDALHEDLKKDNGVSVVSTIFHGEMQSTIMCSDCKIPFVTNDRIISLSVPLLNENEQTGSHDNDNYNISTLQKRLKATVQLQGCIATMMKHEKYGEGADWYCDNDQCKQYTNAEKKLDLWKLPKILIIQLNRFSFDLSSNNKIDTDVDFPLVNLDLKKFVAHPNRNKMYTLYDLIAVSNHSGTMMGGHYTTYAKDVFTNAWYCYNDNSVESIDETKILSKSAYVLVYEQKETS
ncbi:unnamed protein product [Rotaria sp. Silwood2]|nr:unnamed protein product [Rotaria sp. Silwood2]CAF4157659.1 unnamed protein product [Rotaria sp. Silwood2]CAF4556532.1 unnamed protein product [Rotaria sp. Silwood2]